MSDLMGKGNVADFFRHNGAIVFNGYDTRVERLADTVSILLVLLTNPSRVPLGLCDPCETF